MKKRILILLVFALKILLFSYNLTLAESPKNYLKGEFYSSIKNHFLIASEKMSDPRFAETVITIIENDENGAWGLVINKPMGYLPLKFLISVENSPTRENKKLYQTKIPIFWGGPVEEQKIFILHSNEYQSNSTINFGNISISQEQKILIDIAKNIGPKKSMVILGYAGWGDGQLEGEMEKDDWVLSDIDINILFDNDSTKKWKKAYRNSFIKI
tara:strand:- start:610 stop:1251 length:642 start_codon:yes stop_codon:yes gene_type:complete